MNFLRSDEDFSPSGRLSFGQTWFRTFSFRLLFSLDSTSSPEVAVPELSLSSVELLEEDDPELDGDEGEDDGDLLLFFEFFPFFDLPLFLGLSSFFFFFLSLGFFLLRLLDDVASLAPVARELSLVPAARGPSVVPASP